MRGNVLFNEVIYNSLVAGRNEACGYEEKVCSMAELWSSYLLFFTVIIYSFFNLLVHLAVFKKLLLAE